MKACDRYPALAPEFGKRGTGVTAMAAMALTNMRDVVDRLRAEKSAAFAELQEFYSALLEVQRHAETLVRAWREFNQAMQTLVLPEGDVAVAQLRVLRDDTARMSEMAMLLLAAYGEICLGVQGWDIGVSNGASN